MPYAIIIGYFGGFILRPLTKTRICKIRHLVAVKYGLQRDSFELKLKIYLCIYLSIYLSIYLTIYLSISISLSHRSPLSLSSVWSLVTIKVSIRGALQIYFTKRFLGCENGENHRAECEYFQNSNLSSKGNYFFS